MSSFHNVLCRLLGLGRNTDEVGVLASVEQLITNHEDCKAECSSWEDEAGRSHDALEKAIARVTELEKELAEHKAPRLETPKDKPLDSLMQSARQLHNIWSAFEQPRPTCQAPTDEALITFITSVLDYKITLYVETSNEAGEWRPVRQIPPALLESPGVWIPQPSGKTQRVLWKPWVSGRFIPTLTVVSL